MTMEIRVGTSGGRRRVAVAPLRGETARRPVPSGGAGRAVISANSRTTPVSRSSRRRLSAAMLTNRKRQKTTKR